MSPEQMRKELEAWYSAPSWAYKVSKMSDKQVAAVLKRLQSARKYRKEHHCGRDRDHAGTTDVQ